MNLQIHELEPWNGLKELLGENVKIAISATQSRTLKVYGHGEMPNTGLAEEFIYISNNGVIESLTHPLALFKGNIAITIYVKAQSNGTTKNNRIKSAIEQVTALVGDKVSLDGKYFYKFSPSNIITPPTVNASIGYSLTVLNIGWHTT